MANKQPEITGVVFEEMATRKKGTVCCQVFKTAFKFSLPPFLLIRDFGKKTPAETFPKFPSVLRVIDRSDRNIPITAQ